MKGGLLVAPRTLYTVARLELNESTNAEEALDASALPSCPAAFSGAIGATSDLIDLFNHNDGDGGGSSERIGGNKDTDDCHDVYGYVAAEQRRA